MQHCSIDRTGEFSLAFLFLQGNGVIRVLSSDANNNCHMMSLSQLNREQVMALCTVMDTISWLNLYYDKRFIVVRQNLELVIDLKACFVL
jgi:hypothetical protein